MSEARDVARGALTFAAFIFVGALLVWLVFNLFSWGTRATRVGEPIPVSGDPEVRLCDRAVDALLHSKELIEVERGAAIVREIPCGIGRRL